MSDINGKPVPYGMAGSARPDLVVTNGKRQVAVEVKNYDLVNNFSALRRNLGDQMGYRKLNLPDGMSQKVVLDVRGRGYTRGVFERACRRTQEVIAERSN